MCSCERMPKVECNITSYAQGCAELVRMLRIVRILFLLRFDWVTGRTLHQVKVTVD